MDLTAMTNEALAAALAENREKATALFALESPTIEQVNEVEALMASIGGIEAEQAAREAAVRDATERFAAARATFSESASGDADADAEDADAEGETGTTEVEAASEVDVENDGEAEVEDENDDDEEVEEAAVVTASSANRFNSQVIKPAAKSGGSAKAVARRNKRPAVQATPPITITAAADIPNIATGSRLDGMEQVTQALLSRVKGFPKFSESAAEAVRAQSGGEPVLHKFGLASFNVPFPAELTASHGNEYTAVRAALAQDRFGEATLRAGGWCAPSENVYSFIADYVVDGLISVPEVNAPRGGINITTGPERSSQGTALDDFGFVQTEAQAIAGDVKTCETIECPPFVDHRLDAIGYCYKIPILTQKSYPELITDALRFANVLYAHKVNRRIISDLVALSGSATAAPYGATFTDTLEALSIIAVKERRRWSVGESAIMEVKLPTFAREVFRADMSRRNALALSDVATDQKISAEFSARNLAVEYVSDWQELAGPDAAWPAVVQAMIYPSGTFIKAVEDVISLQTVYDAASLSVNEYTGVFFEQGILTAKAGYGSTLVTIPICTAGATGAQSLDCAAGSF